MRYKFTYRTTALDFWQLSMYYTYGSMLGVCNVIFTVAMFLLTIKFWAQVTTLTKLILILACSLFTVIQPICIYIRAKRQAAAALQGEMEIGFDDKGVHVKAGNQSSDLKWNTIKRVSRKPSMIVVFSTTTHGFILNNKVLGQQKEAFYDYVVSKIQN